MNAEDRKTITDNILRILENANYPPSTNQIINKYNQLHDAHITRKTANSILYALNKNGEAEKIDEFTPPSWIIPAPEDD